jgi:hypothetical protein
MIDMEWAREFALDWIEAWNSRDLDRILSHYTDDFTMSSPTNEELLHIPDGMLRGKEEVRENWQKSLAMLPSLHFELIDVFAGINVITIYFNNSGRKLVAETLLLNNDRKVTRGFAQWSVINKM